MKKLVYTAVLFILTSTAYSQSTKDLFQDSDYDYVYLGIDFSKAKFIGDFSQFADAGSTSMVKIKEFYFDAWNNVIINEREKYDIAGAMRKEDLSYDIDAVHAINETTVVEEMDAASADKLAKADIQDQVEGHEFKTDSEIGFLFVVEYFNKNRASASIHFVALNLSDNNILLHERFIGKAGGFGLRNYWARTFYETIKQIDKRFKKWRKEYVD